MFTNLREYPRVLITSFDIEVERKTVDNLRNDYLFYSQFLEFLAFLINLHVS